MLQWKRALCVASAALAAAVVPGCFTYRELTILLPDGSGKMLLTLRIPLAPDKEGTKDVAGERERSARSWADGIAAGSEGIAAITNISEEKSGEGTSVSCVLWFDDANKLALCDPSGEADEPYRLKWRAEGDGFVLETTNDAVLGAAAWALGERPAPLDLPPSLRDTVGRSRTKSKKALSGLDVRVQIRLPGLVTGVEKFVKSSDRSVSSSLTADDSGDSKKRARLRSSEPFVARCGPSVMTEAEIAEFKEELAAAKETWKSDPASRVVTARVTGNVLKCEEYVDFWQVLDDAGSLLTILDPMDEDETPPFPVFWNAGKRTATLAPGWDYIDRAWRTADGRKILLNAWGEGRLAAFDASTGKQLWERRAEEDEDAFWTAALLAGDVLVLVIDYESVECINLETGETLRKLPGEWEADELIAVPGKPHFAIAEGNIVSVVDAANAKRVWKRDLPEGEYELVAGVSGGPLLVGRYQEAWSTTWQALDPATGKTLWTLRDLAGNVTVARSGRVALVEDRTARTLVDLTSGEVRGRIRVSPRATPMQMQFLDDRTLLFEPDADPDAADDDYFDSVLVKATIEGPAAPK